MFSQSDLSLILLPLKLMPLKLNLGVTWFKNYHLYVHV